MNPGLVTVSSLASTSPGPPKARYSSTCQTIVVITASECIKVAIFFS